MPGPRSRTAIDTCCGGSASTRISARSPNLSALSTKLVTTRRSAFGRVTIGCSMRPTSCTCSPASRIVADQAVQQRMQVDAAGVLGCALGATGVGDPFLDQRLHRIQVAMQLVPERRAVEQVGAQAHSRDRRLQIMRGGRQHANALGEMAGDPALHGIERHRRPGHFQRTVLGERTAPKLGTKRVGGARKLRQGAGGKPHRDPSEHGQHGQLHG
jgi:hypothetical protein